jgi:TATA-binding protein-associated factor
LIINYEKVKSNLDQLRQTNFFYVVLDEAHKIKNSKAVVTQSVRQIKADRKLALSGTPLQNRVSELWSLFDFILPDFLEDEQTFNKTYNKYLSGNIKRMQEKLEDTQQFIEALKSLKRRIAPFILRRTKEDVLKELPPKVIQDYDCVMPETQQQCHLLVERSHPFANVVGKNTNSLQNLILHRKACNHPVLLKGLVD